MPRPLEVWLPLIDPMASLGSTKRDLERAIKVRQFEMTVWIVPTLDEPKHWHCPAVPGKKHVAIPGESINRFDVAFVGQNDFVDENIANRRIGTTKASELLMDWLAVGQNGEDSCVQLSYATKRFS